MKSPKLKGWFDNCGGWAPRHHLEELRSGIKMGWINNQDELGMTALCFAVCSSWQEGVEELLRAGADTELYFFRTGETALYMAVQGRNESIIVALVAAGANPDAPNRWGITPRDWAIRRGSAWFDRVPTRKMPPLAAHIQNAEHLADHSASFKIPQRAERESLEVGCAVDIYVYGPKAESKGDAIKVRIQKVTGSGPASRYTAILETPLVQTHLTNDTTTLDFGPEHVASVYRNRPAKKN